MADPEGEPSPDDRTYIDDVQDFGAATCSLTDVHGYGVAAPGPDTEAPDDDFDNDNLDEDEYSDVGEDDDGGESYDEASEDEDHFVPREGGPRTQGSTNVAPGSSKRFAVNEPNTGIDIAQLACRGLDEPVFYRTGQPCFAFDARTIEEQIGGASKECLPNSLILLISEMIDAIGIEGRGRRVRFLSFLRGLMHLVAPESARETIDFVTPCSWRTFEKRRTEMQQIRARPPG